MCVATLLLDTDSTFYVCVSSAVAKILNVGEDAEVGVIGTLYKDMKLKPSILDEYSKDRGLKQALGGTNFTADTDSLILEDEGARMVLRGDNGSSFPVDQLVTGQHWHVGLRARGGRGGGGG